MLGINSNINSLVAQQNLTGSGSALSQAITRLSSGKRINSAADDAAGLAISNIMQTQINGLNQGVSNANNGVSMVQTASSGLASLTSSLQTIRQLATQASDGSMTDTDRQALQQEVAQQIQEVNRIASQTTYNGMNVLNGSLGTVSFQVGANVGQSISLNLTQNMSAAQLGGGKAQAGNTLGSYTNLSLNADGSYSGTAAVAGSSITDKLTATSTDGVNVTYKNSGGTTVTDPNEIAAANAEYATEHSITGAGAATALADAAKAAYQPAVSPTITPTSESITSVTEDSSGNFFDQSGNAITDSTTLTAVQAQIAANTTNPSTITAGGAAVTLDTAVSGTVDVSSGGSAAQNGVVSDANTFTTTTAGTKAVASGNAAINTINVVSDGNGNVTLTDQNNMALSSGALNALVTASNGALTLGTDGSTISLSTTAANGTTLGSALSSAVESLNNDTLSSTTGGVTTTTNVNATNVTADAAVGSQIDNLNTPTSVATIDISTQQGASNAMEAIDNALNTVDNLQATLGAAQNRFTAITTTQQAQSTDLSSAQSSIQDADFAQETANLSKAQVLQQAGISVLAQANSQPQQILKLLQ